MTIDFYRLYFLQGKPSLYPCSFLALYVPYIGGADDFATGLVKYGADSSTNFFAKTGVY